jgi:asparagine synthase (glutamine-hydrolysing)
MWGVARFDGQTDGLKKTLADRLQERADVEWAAGDDWCLVWEGCKGTAHALASFSRNGLHVAAAGNAWPLGSGSERDAHLVASLYQTVGNAVINECDGQFAAAIVDEKNGRTILTVNWPGGFHSLYYGTDGQSLCFSTRLDLLVRRCGWPAKVNEQAVVDLLRFGGLVGEPTMLEGVHRVIPGSVVVFQEGRTVQQMVYQQVLTEDHAALDTTQLAALHREAVQRRISGQDGFGLFLSGGLDSGLNVAAAAELSSRPVKTFSAAFDAAEFDESPYARLIAAKYKTEHTEVRLGTAECLDRLPDMVWAMQEPIIDYSYVPTFYVAEAIKQHVDVAIGGDGPDHFLGRNYQYAAWYDLLSRIPFGRDVATWLVQANRRGARVRCGLWRYARRHRLGRQLWQSFACTAVPCGSGMLGSFCNDLWGDLPPHDVVRLLSPDLLRRVQVEAFNPAWMDRWRLGTGSDSRNTFILADASLSGVCGVFAKAGAMSAAHNLTIHEPYLAAPLIRYFYGLDDSWRVHGSWLRRLTRRIPTAQTKRALRRLAADYLPEEIISQKQKHGFEFPLVQCWQQSTAGLDARLIFGELLGSTDWFDPIYLNRLVQEQASGRRNHRYLLLLLAALDQWLRIFVKGDAKPPNWSWAESF